MIDDGTEEQFAIGLPWPVHAIPTLRRRLPGDPLPEGDALRALLTQAEAKEPEAIQRLYYGSLHKLAGTVVARASNSWRKAHFFLRILSVHILDALVRHDATTDGSLERFLALRTACGFAQAQEAWCQRPAPSFAEQAERMHVSFQMGSIHPDEEVIRAFYERTLLSNERIKRALLILTRSHVPFDGPAQEDESDPTPWLPSTDHVPENDPILSDPDDPDPVLDRDADQTELDGSDTQTEDRLLAHTPSPYAATCERMLTRQVLRTLATLTPREEKVIRMRFGIGYPSDYTLEEVGQEFEVTRERIRQIEAKALRKLRHPSRSRELRAFVEEKQTEDECRLHKTTEPHPPARSPRHPFVDTGFVLTVTEARKFAYIENPYLPDQPRFPNALLAEMDKWGLAHRQSRGRFVVSEAGMARVRIIVTRDEHPPKSRLRFLDPGARYQRVPQLGWRQEILAQFADLKVLLPEDTKRFRMDRSRYEHEERWRM